MNVSVEVNQQNSLIIDFNQAYSINGFYTPFLINEWRNHSAMTGNGHHFRQTSLRSIDSLLVLLLFS